MDMFPKLKPLGSHFIVKTSSNATPHTTQQSAIFYRSSRSRGQPNNITSSSSSYSSCADTLFSSSVSLRWSRSATFRLPISNVHYPQIFFHPIQVPNSTSVCSSRAPLAYGMLTPCQGLPPVS